MFNQTGNLTVSRPLNVAPPSGEHVYISTHIRLWLGNVVFLGSLQNTKDAKITSAEPQANSQKEEN